MKQRDCPLEEVADLVQGPPAGQIRATRETAQRSARKILQAVKETEIWSRMTGRVSGFWAVTDDVHQGVVLWG